jgi:hypothetical protein
VVEGAKLSDAAGQALTEIDFVTKNLVYFATIAQRYAHDYGLAPEELGIGSRVSARPSPR